MGRRTPRLSPPRVQVATPGLARYYNELRAAQLAEATDRFYGRIPPEPGPFDGIDLPEDPTAALRAVNAAPQKWLDNAMFARAVEMTPAEPLADMLRRNDRSRALTRSRLERMTPEQRSRSLATVAQDYAADLKARREAEIAHARARADQMKLAGGMAAGGLAFAGRAAQEAYEQGMFDEPPASPDALDQALQATDAPGDPEEYPAGDGAQYGLDPFSPEVEIEEDLPELIDYLRATAVPDEGIDGSVPGMLSAARAMLAEEPLIELGPAEPDNYDPIPEPYMTNAQLRTANVLMEKLGIPEGRAKMIARGEASITMDERRQLTGRH